MSKFTAAFRVLATKRDGERRDKVYSKINHALRALWRIRDVREGYIRVTQGLLVRQSMIAKIGRKRCVWRELAELPPGRPVVKDMPSWSRLPSRFNEIT